MRQAAAESLGKIGPNAKAAIPALLRLLRDRHGVVRVAAAESLWRIARHPSAITSLVSELRRREDPNAVVEEAMAQLVMRPGAPTVQDAVAALLEISRDTDHPAHILAAVALWKIDNRYDPIPVLVAGLDNERYFTRFLAADSLEEIGPAARVAVPNLVEALRNFAAEAPTLAKRGVPEGPLLCDFGRINSRLLFEHARRAAERALRAIDPDAAAKAGIHTW
jgi:HEAT repeat protein